MDISVALLVVGGGAAGHSAVTAYRERGGTGPVLLVSDDDVAPYLRPPLSKDYLRGEAGEQDLPLAPDGYDDVEVRTGTAVTALSPAGRRARLSDGDEVGYRWCVLATGSAPVEPPVPGADGPGVAYLRSLADARSLRHRAARVSRAVVVGSGFIGCEAAVSLARRGVEVTVCSSEAVPQQERLGDAVADRIAGWLRAERVSVRGGAEVTGIEDTHSGPTVHVRDGDPVPTGLVLVAAGAAPRVSTAADAGLAVEQGRVVVDERMRSGADGVLAAGDVAFARNAAAGRHLVVEHWGEAEEMGRIAGTTAAGGDAVWDAPPGFWTEIGDATLKHVAWGDGYDEVRMDARAGEEGFTAWYARDGVIVGVATHLADDDYDRGTELVRTGAPVRELDRPRTPAPGGA